MSPNDLIAQQKEYDLVFKIAEDLDRGDVLSRLSGNCLTAADIFQNLLEAHGIKSRILECNLIITKKIGNQSNQGVRLIGYNFVGKTNTTEEIDTHAIVLVEAPIPFIVDASIGYIFGNPKLVFTFPLCSTDPEIISKETHEDYSLIYRTKKNIRLTALHQKTLLERVNEDTRLRKQVGYLGLAVKILIGVGLFNMVANTALIVLKAMFP